MGNGGFSWFWELSFLFWEELCCTWLITTVQYIMGKFLMPGEEINGQFSTVASICRKWAKAKEIDRKEIP
jgi:hypothetical protein